MSLSFGAFSQDERGQIAGKIIDVESAEPIIFGPVVLTKNGERVAVVQTDIDGNYSVSIEPGDYDLEASYIGYQAQHIEGVRLFANRLTPLNISLIRGELMEGVEILDYKIPEIEQDFTTQGRTITSDGSMTSLPLKNIDIIRNIAGLNSSIIGSRIIGDLVMAQLLILTSKNLLPSDIEFLKLLRTSFELALLLRRR